MDLDDELLAWLGSSDVIHKLLKDRVVDFDGESRGVDRLVDAVEAVVDDCLGSRLEPGMPRKLSGDRWRRDVAAFDGEMII